MCLFNLPLSLLFVAQICSPETLVFLVKEDGKLS